ncbi:MAG TPA: RsmG family class I SAM-dependent methyltransferase [Polyangiaceae bacterium]
MPLEPLGQKWDPLIRRALEALAENGVAALGRYLDELVRWNEKTDLTAARTPEELVDLTLADAAVIARASFGPSDTEDPSLAPSETSRRRRAWVDVGSGAGAPGLVLALLAPESLRMTLVEPKDRRVAFLRSIVGTLGLSHVTVTRGRSDTLPPHGWETAVSRATLSPPEWLREGARLARSEVWVLLARDEPPALPGFRVDTDIRYEWPLTSAPRRALRYVPAEAGK